MDDNKKVESVRFDFENCESFSLSIDSFVKLFFSDIVELVYIFPKEESILKKDKIAKFVFLEIEKDANIIIRESDNNSFVSEDYFVFDRLTEWADIVAINIFFSDGSKKEYYVDFCEKRDEVNLYQTNKICENGNLRIVISRDKTASDFS